MANLQIKGIDSDLYAQIKALAAAENRSVSQQIVFLAREYLAKTFFMGVYIDLPPLRDRREDIPSLVDYFLARHNDRFHQHKQLSREGMRRILEYAWPGNIRELENAIERAFVLSKGQVIKDADLPLEILFVATPLAKGAPLSSNREKDIPLFPPFDKGGQGGFLNGSNVIIPPDGLDLAACLLDLEKAYYAEAIRLKDGNREAAARLLKIKPHTFRKRAKEKFGL